MKDSLPWHVVDAYRKTFTRQKLPDSGFANMQSREYHASWRAGKVAEDAGYIALPRACGDAALIASYAMLKCEELYGYQCWQGSRLTPAQREFAKKYRCRTSSSG